MSLTFRDVKSICREPSRRQTRALIFVWRRAEPFKELLLKGGNTASRFECRGVSLRDELLHNIDGIEVGDDTVIARIVEHQPQDVRASRKIYAALADCLESSPISSGWSLHRPRYIRTINLEMERAAFHFTSNAGP